MSTYHNNASSADHVWAKYEKARIDLAYQNQLRKMHQRQDYEWRNLVERRRQGDISNDRADWLIIRHARELEDIRVEASFRKEEKELYDNWSRDIDNLCRR